MSRRFYWLVMGGSLVLAAGLATGLVLAFAGGSASGGHSLTPAAYRSQVAVVCERYGRQLDQIPPPKDLAVYGEVTTAVGRALPVLKKLEAEIRAIPPPGQLRAGAERLAGVRDRSIALLTRALAAGRRRELGPMAEAVIEFSASRDQGRALARTLGLAC